MSSNSSSMNRPTARCSSPNKNEDNSDVPLCSRFLQRFTELDREHKRFKQEAMKPSPQAYSRMQRQLTGISECFTQDSPETRMNKIREKIWRTHQPYYGPLTLQRLKDSESANDFTSRTIEEDDEFSRKREAQLSNKKEDSPQKRLQAALEQINKKKDLHPLLVPIPTKPFETEERRKLKEEQVAVLFADDVEEALKDYLTKHGHPWGPEDFPDVGKVPRMTQLGTLEELPTPPKDKDENEVHGSSSTCSYNTAKESTPISNFSDVLSIESADNVQNLSSQDLESFFSQSSTDEYDWMDCEADLGYGKIKPAKINTYSYLKDRFGSILATYQDSILLDSIALQILKKSARFVDRTICKMEPSDDLLCSVMKKLTRFLNRKFVKQYNIVERKRKKFDDGSDYEDEVESQQAKRKRCSN